MFLQLIFLTLALSIDAFGIGISYGVRKIKFSFISFLIISIISLTFSSLSLYVGNIISLVLNPKITSFLSIFILIILGLFIIKKGLEKNEQKKEIANNNTIYSLFIKSMGITINIIKSPSYGDLNHSFKIEPKEALYLGIALSIDCIGAGIAASSFNFYAYLFPIFIMIFQLVFLTSGMFLGKKLKIKNLDESKLSLISGIILILMGVLRVFVS